jgi:hypothetical protein
MTAGVSVTSMGNGAPVVRWKGGRKWTHARKLHTGVAFSKLEPSRSCCTYASESFSGSPSGSTDFSFQILTGNINELRASGEISNLCPSEWDVVVHWQCTEMESYADSATGREGPSYPEVGAFCWGLFSYTHTHRHTNLYYPLNNEFRKKKKLQQAK